MLGIVNKIFVFKYFAFTPFPPIIWIFTEGKSDGIKSRLSSSICFTFFLDYKTFKIERKLCNIFFSLYQILTFLTYFLGYCGIQYSAYSATSPDAFILDDITITANNVSSSLFFKYQEKVRIISQFQRFFFYFSMDIRVCFISIK